MEILNLIDKVFGILCLVYSLFIIKNISKLFLNWEYNNYFKLKLYIAFLGGLFFLFVIFFCLDVHLVDLYHFLIKKLL
jgi:hypothetical protein